jgi:hypothetical protein
MKQHLIVLSGIITLALVFMIGACAAEETTGTGLNIASEETPVIQTAPSEAVQGEGTALVDDIAPYDGAVGPGSPLYGLKIAFEDLDESFTFNETERLNKQLNTARLRLSEVKRELLLNNTDAAGRALEIYGLKTNITQLRLAAMSSSNATGLLHAQEMVTKHQSVLATLLLSHPNNTGLARAYNNSLALERKFEEKTQMRFERVMAKNNQTIVKAVRLALKEQERTENAGQNQTVQVRQTNTVRQGEGNGKDNGKGGRVTQTAAETSAPAPATTAEPAGTADTGKGNPDNAGNGNTKVTGNGNAGNSASDNRGQGNGKN